MAGAAGAAQRRADARARRWRRASACSTSRAARACRASRRRARSGRGGHVRRRRPVRADGRARRDVRGRSASVAQRELRAHGCGAPGAARRELRRRAVRARPHVRARSRAGAARDAPGAAARRPRRGRRVGRARALRLGAGVPDRRGRSRERRVPAVLPAGRAADARASCARMRGSTSSTSIASPRRSTMPMPTMRATPRSSAARWRSRGRASTTTSARACARATSTRSSRGAAAAAIGSRASSSSPSRPPRRQGVRDASRALRIASDERPHRRGVEPAAVVARDDEEVRAGDPVGRARSAVGGRILEREQAHGVRRKLRREHVSGDAVALPRRQRAPLADAAVELAQHRVALVGVDRRGQQHGLARAASRGGRGIRDAADRRRSSLRPQVDVPVAVEVDREAAIAARHELRHAHRAGERALRRQRRQALLAREPQVFLQLAAKERRAPRIVEGERGRARRTRDTSPVLRP